MALSWKSALLAGVSIFTGFIVPAWSQDSTPQPEPKPERAFWVGPRDKPLADPERAELQKQGIVTLYWYTAEVETANGPWRFSRWPTSPERSTIDFRIVPVVKITSREPNPLNPEYLDMLIDRLTEVSRRSGSDEIQIDWTPPERLLGPYAELLAKVRQKTGRVSIVARPEWVRNPAFKDLQAATDEIIPRFFEQSALLEENAPLFDIPAVRTDIEAWKAIRTHWRIGLPSFNRVTIYDVAGQPRTDLRLWTWSDFINQDLLQPVGVPCPDTTLLRMTSASAVARTAVEQDEILAVRTPVRTALAEAEKLSGVGSVFYRMPDGSDEPAWSIRQIGSLSTSSTATPNLVLRVGAGLTLINDSQTDLPPKLAGDPSQRSYAVQIEAPFAVFREAREGDFDRLVAEGDPDMSRREKAHKKDKPLRPVQMLPTSVSLASRLTFYFSHLPAGSTLQVHSLQLLPEGSYSDLKVRFLNVPGRDQWEPLATAAQSFQPTPPQ